MTRPRITYAARDAVEPRIVKLYRDEGLPIIHVAERLGVSKHLVAKTLDAHNIAIRPKGRPTISDELTPVSTREQLDHELDCKQGSLSLLVAYARYWERNHAREAA